MVKFDLTNSSKNLNGKALFADRVVSFIIEDKLYKALKQVLSEVDDVCHNLKHMKDIPIQVT